MSKQTLITQYLKPDISVEITNENKEFLKVLSSKLALHQIYFLKSFEEILTKFPSLLTRKNIKKIILKYTNIPKNKPIDHIIDHQYKSFLYKY